MKSVRLFNLLLALALLPALLPVSSAQSPLVSLSSESTRPSPRSPASGATSTYAGSNEKEVLK